jgi:exodeoxyribonuclease-3
MRLNLNRHHNIMQFRAPYPSSFYCSLFVIRYLFAVKIQPMKIVCWNVNGVRAVAKKGFAEQVNSWNADMICLQETKAQDDEVRAALVNISGYEIIPSSAIRKGYSGTCIMTRQKPRTVTFGLGKSEHDQEGRTITAEYDTFYLLTTYIPNSGSDLGRLDYRQGWDKDFRNYLSKLQKKKPVIACGDFNVAHQPIDLARPKENYNKTSGYTQVEIDGMTALLKEGFVDTYRHLRPDEVGYSWWSARFGARAKNIGWRIDYFIVSNSFMPYVVDSYILPDEMGSDHCPVVLVTK